MKQSFYFNRDKIEKNNVFLHTYKQNERNKKVHLGYIKKHT